MKKIFLFLFCLSFFSLNAQEINEKMLKTFQYHNYHKSQYFKATFKSSINRAMVQKLFSEGDINDDIQVSQIAKYNLRVRWKFKNQNRLYLGTETMNRGYGKNTFYIGLRKPF